MDYYKSIAILSGSAAFRFVIAKFLVGSVMGDYWRWCMLCLSVCVCGVQVKLKTTRRVSWLTARLYQGSCSVGGS